MVTWVTWVRGSYFYVVCVGYVGQNIFYVGNILRGSYILRGLRGSNIFCVDLCVGPKFLRGSKILFTRRDYFSILQLMASRIFSRVFLKCYGGPRSTFANKLIKNTKEAKQGLVEICWEEQQILIKPCLTSSIFE